jgi:hypothetical protein
VRTDISQGKGFSLIGTAQQNRLVQQGYSNHLTGLESVTGHGMVPDITQESRVVNGNHGD